MVDAEIAAAIKAERQRVARLGGLARTKSMTAKQRKELATKASKAAARARTQRAKLKRLAGDLTEGTKNLRRTAKQRRRRSKKKSPRGPVT